MGVSEPVLMLLDPRSWCGAGAIPGAPAPQVPAVRASGTPKNLCHPASHTPEGTVPEDKGAGDPGQSHDCPFFLFFSAGLSSVGYSASVGEGERFGVMLGGQPTWGESRIKNLGSRCHPSKPWGKMAQPGPGSGPCSLASWAQTPGPLALAHQASSSFQEIFPLGWPSACSTSIAAPGSPSGPLSLRGETLP